MQGLALALQIATMAYTSPSGNLSACAGMNLDDGQLPAHQMAPKSRDIMEDRAYNLLSSDGRKGQEKVARVERNQRALPASWGPNGLDGVVPPEMYMVGRRYDSEQTHHPERPEEGVSKTFTSNVSVGGRVDDVTFVSDELFRQQSSDLLHERHQTMGFGGRLAAERLSGPEETELPTLQMMNNHLVDELWETQKVHVKHVHLLGTQGAVVAAKIAEDVTECNALRHRGAVTVALCVAQAKEPGVFNTDQHKQGGQHGKELHGAPEAGLDATIGDPAIRIATIGDPPKSRRISRNRANDTNASIIDRAHWGYTTWGGIHPLPCGASEYALWMTKDSLLTNLVISRASVISPVTFTISDSYVNDMILSPVHCTESASYVNDLNAFWNVSPVPCIDRASHVNELTLSTVPCTAPFVNDLTPCPMLDFIRLVVATISFLTMAGLDKKSKKTRAHLGGLSASTWLHGVIFMIILINVPLSTASPSERTRTARSITCTPWTGLKEDWLMFVLGFMCMLGNNLPKSLPFVFAAIPSLKKLCKYKEPIDEDSDSDEASSSDDDVSSDSSDSSYIQDERAMRRHSRRNTAKEKQRKALTKKKIEKKKKKKPESIPFEMNSKLFGELTQALPKQEAAALALAFFCDGVGAIMHLHTKNGASGTIHRPHARMHFFKNTMSKNATYSSKDLDVLRAQQDKGKILMEICEMPTPTEVEQKEAMKGKLAPVYDSIVDTLERDDFDTFIAWFAKLQDQVVMREERANTRRTEEATALQAQPSARPNFDRAPPRLARQPSHRPSSSQMPHPANRAASSSREHRAPISREAASARIIHCWRCWKTDHRLTECPDRPIVCGYVDPKNPKATACKADHHPITHDVARGKISEPMDNKRFNDCVKAGCHCGPPRRFEAKPQPRAFQAVADEPVEVAHAFNAVAVPMLPAAAMGSPMLSNVLMDYKAALMAPKGDDDRISASFEDVCDGGELDESARRARDQRSSVLKKLRVLQCEHDLMHLKCYEDMPDSSNDDDFVEPREIGQLPWSASQWWAAASHCTRTTTSRGDLAKVPDELEGLGDAKSHLGDSASHSSSSSSSASTYNGNYHTDGSSEPEYLVFDEVLARDHGLIVKTEQSEGPAVTTPEEHSRALAESTMSILVVDDRTDLRWTTMSPRPFAQLPPNSPSSRAPSPSVQDDAPRDAGAILPPMTTQLVVHSGYPETTAAAFSSHVQGLIIDQLNTIGRAEVLMGEWEPSLQQWISECAAYSYAAKQMIDSGFHEQLQCWSAEDVGGHDADLSVTIYAVWLSNVVSLAAFGTEYEIVVKYLDPVVYREYIENASQESRQKSHPNDMLKNCLCDLLPLSNGTMAQKVFALASYCDIDIRWAQAALGAAMWDSRAALDGIMLSMMARQSFRFPACPDVLDVDGRLMWRGVSGKCLCVCGCDEFIGALDKTGRCSKCLASAQAFGGRCILSSPFRLNHTCLQLLPGFNAHTDSPDCAACQHKGPPAQYVPPMRYSPSMYSEVNAFSALPVPELVKPGTPEPRTVQEEQAFADGLYFSRLDDALERRNEDEVLAAAIARAAATHPSNNTIAFQHGTNMCHPETGPPAHRRPTGSIPRSSQIPGTSRSTGRGSRTDGAAGAPGLGRTQLGRARRTVQCRHPSGCAVRGRGTRRHHQRATRDWSHVVAVESAPKLVAHKTLTPHTRVPKPQTSKKRRYSEAQRRKRNKACRAMHQRKEQMMRDHSRGKEFTNKFFPTMPEEPRECVVMMAKEIKQEQSRYSSKSRFASLSEDYSIGDFTPEVGNDETATRNLSPVVVYIDSCAPRGVTLTCILVSGEQIPAIIFSLIVVRSSDFLKITKRRKI